MSEANTTSPAPPQEGYESATRRAAVPLGQEQVDSGPPSRVVVITGAGSGLGRITTREFLRRGHHVVLAGRRRQNLLETARDHPQALIVPTDVTDPRSVKSLFADTIDHFGRVDVLFNNAGIFGPQSAITELADQEWHATWRTNVDGAIFCAREAAKAMQSQYPRGGRIINNGSVSAHRPRPNATAYTVTKHAISGLTASLQLDLRELDIAVTQIDIGNAATAMTTNLGLAEPDDGPAPQAEPTFDPIHVARTVVHIAEMPLDVAVPSICLIARAMPYAGRG